MNPYVILKVGDLADFKTIEKSFKRLCLLFHPDKGGSNAAMRDLLEARKIIGDPVSRFIWDKSKNVKKCRDPGERQKVLRTYPGILDAAEWPYEPVFDVYDTDDSDIIIVESQDEDSLPPDSPPPAPKRRRKSRKGRHRSRGENRKKKNNC